MSRKRKKEDRAKTQFKKPKTAPGRHLPKGTNETRTEFKVAQIVIPGQRGEAASAGSGPRTSKKLGLKDVLGKLGHFSQSVRSDGVQGLKELVALSDPTSASLISSNLARVLGCLVPLCQDKERKIRQETVALLGSVLRQVSPSQLAPFHPLLAAHLACCLTNIDPRVQQEGLDLLDSLLEAAPSFIVTQYQAIVPNCLDQISNKKTSAASKGPKVAANLSEKVTAIQWRLSVLSRVNRILELATTREEKVASQVMVEEEEHRPGRHYGLLRREAAGLSLASVSRAEQDSSVGDIIQLVVPLILETWVEARADGQSKTSALTSESSSLLLSIAGILDRLLALVTGLEVTRQWLTTSAEVVVSQFLLQVQDVLTNVTKMEESLRKLKKVRGGAGERDRDRTVGLSDDDKIRLQLYLDVSYFLRELSSGRLAALVLVTESQEGVMIRRVVEEAVQRFINDLNL